MYKTKSGKEIDVEAATVYINRPDLVLKVIDSIPAEIPLHFVQAINQSKCRDLKEEVLQKRPDIKWYEKIQEGCATDWNYCSKLPKSKYLLLVSSDVSFGEGLVDESFDVALEHPEIKVWSYKKKNMKAWLYDVKFFWEMGGFDQQFWIGGEDEDFMWRMMKKDHDFGTFRTHRLNHLEGGAHTRNMVRPVNHIKSASILVNKWGWASKREMNEEIKPLEAKYTKAFWV